MTTIRALIADYSVDPPTVIDSTDRDQIAKMIRQGGRRVWLNVTEDESDNDTRDWLAATINVSRSLFEIEAPLFEHDPALAFGLLIPVSNRREGGSWQTALPALIVVRGATLLTVRRIASTGWNALFDVAAKQIPNWRDQFTGTLYELVKVLVDESEHVLEFATSQYTATRADVFAEHAAPNYGNMAVPVYRWQSGASPLRDFFDNADYSLTLLYEHLADSQTDQAAIWPFMTLVTGFASANAKFNRAFADSEQLLSVLNTMQNGLYAKAQSERLAGIKQLDRRMQRLTNVALIAVGLLVVVTLLIVVALALNLRAGR